MKKLIILSILLFLIVAPVMGRNISHVTATINSRYGCANGDQYCKDITVTSPNIDFTVPQDNTITDFYITRTGGIYFYGFTVWSYGGLLSIDDKWDITIYRQDGTTISGYMESGSTTPLTHWNNLKFDGIWWNSTEILAYDLAVLTAITPYDDGSFDSGFWILKGNTAVGHNLTFIENHLENPITRIVINSQSGQASTYIVTYRSLDSISDLITDYKNALVGPGQSAVALLKFTQTAFTAALEVLSTLYVLFDWLVLRAGFVFFLLIIELGAMAVHINKSKDVFQFFEKMIKTNKSLFEFMANFFFLLIQTLQAGISLFAQVTGTLASTVLALIYAII